MVQNLVLHYSHPLTNLVIKVMDFEILRWSFWLKVFRIGYLLNLWMDLVDTTPDVKYWSKILRSSTPILNLLTNLQIKVTDLKFFMINELYLSISHQKAFIFQIWTLEGLLPFHNY